MTTTETKQIRVQAKGVKAIGESGEFEAIIATLNVVDSDGDIIVPGAFGDMTTMIVPTHNHGSIPLGKARMEDRGSHAVAIGRFNLDIEPGREWHNALKFDLDNPPSVQEWSFAYRVLDSEMEVRDGEQVRVLKKMDIMEVSPVLRGAGVGTGTLMAKSRFEEQLDATLQAVDDTLDRAKQIAEMRASKAKPKTIATERLERLHQVMEKCRELETVLKACEKSVHGDNDDASPEAQAIMDTEFSRSRRLGVSVE